MKLASSVVTRDILFLIFRLRSKHQLLGYSLPYPPQCDNQQTLPISFCFLVNIDHFTTLLNHRFLNQLFALGHNKRLDTSCKSLTAGGGALNISAVSNLTCQAAVLHQEKPGNLVVPWVVAFWGDRLISSSFLLSRILSLFFFEVWRISIWLVDHVPILV